MWILFSVAKASRAGTYCMAFAKFIWRSCGKFLELSWKSFGFFCELIWMTFQAYIFPQT